MASQKGDAVNIQELVRETKVQPRPYQERIVRKALDLFCNQGVRSVLIDSPTGSGKTLMGLMIARALHERLGLQVGWVAMRRHLLAQAARENAAKGIDAPCTWISMFDRNPPTGLDLLVVDEAQHDAVGSMAHLHNVIQPRFILGLSATPFRTDRMKLCFDTVIKDAGIHRLIQDGYLSRFHHFTIPDYTPASVAGVYCREPGRWGRALVSFHTLKQCQACRDLLTAGGVRADVVTGQSNREGQIEAFQAGELDVLINCLVLGEGFDCPDLKTVFCRPGCRTVTIQTCGRVLRTHPELPFKQLVQCRDTPWPFTRTAGADLQYVWMDGEWRTLQANPWINDIGWRVLKAMSQVRVELPPFLVKRRARPRWSERRDTTLLVNGMPNP
jgi:superfamily II DNA or RNA helicase